MQWFRTYKASPLRRLFAVGSVFACLLAAVGHLGLVLCIGDCGVSQIELALDGCCSESEAGESGHVTSVLNRTSDSGLPADCGDCVDIPLVSPAFNSPPVLRSIANDQPTTLVAALLPRAVPVLNAPVCDAITLPPFVSCASTRTLRSTIILI